MNLLQNIQILDFTRLLPGPVATHLLAQMGAEVIKIENPKRVDYARLHGKQVDGASLLFHQLNHNKELKSIDYTTAEGKAEVVEMIRQADALIEQFRPGAMTAWGLGYDEVKKINPQIVYVSLTGYGQEGAYANEAGHDFNYLAYSGVMSLLKDEKGKPTVPDAQFADISGGYMAVMAMQAALIKKAYSGEGSYLDVSLADSMMPFLAVPYSFTSAGWNYRHFNVINGKIAANYAAYQCKDGKWLSVGALELKFWNNLCDVLEKAEWKRDNQLALMNIAFPKQEVESLFLTKNRDEWMEILMGKDVCVAPVLELEELEESPFHQDRKSFETFETPGGTELKTMGLPFRLGED